MKEFVRNLSLLSTDYDIIVITESWLNEKKLEASELNNPTFFFYRQDRTIQNAERGGGILVGVNKKLISGVCNTLEIINSKYEQIYITVIKNECRFIIGAVYIPYPSLGILQDLSMYVGDLMDVYVDHNFIFLGDFNLPKVMWFMDNNKIKFDYAVDIEQDILQCS